MLATLQQRCRPGACNHRAGRRAPVGGRGAAGSLLHPQVSPSTKHWRPPTRSTWIRSVEASSRKQASSWPSVACSRASSMSFCRPGGTHGWVQGRWV